jgi:hypothetical protein
MARVVTDDILCVCVWSEQGDYEKPLPVAPPRRTTGEQPSAQLLARPHPACTAKPARRQAVSARACADASNGAANGETPRASPEIQHELARSLLGAVTGPTLHALQVPLARSPSIQGRAPARFYPPLRRLSPPREGQASARAKGGTAGSRVGDGRWLRGARTRTTASRHWRRGQRGAPGLLVGSCRLPPLRPFTRWREQGTADRCRSRLQPGAGGAAG